MARVVVCADMKFTILGQVKSGKNNMQVAWVKGRVMHFPLKSFKVWRADTVGQILQQLNDCGYHVPYDFPCKTTINYWRSDNRRRDVPGMIDALFHVFEKCGLVRDDSLFEEVHWIPRGMSKDSPRVEIWIEKIQANADEV